MNSGQADRWKVTTAFPATSWSLIQDIQAEDDRQRALIGLLLETYWKPIFCYLRHKGYDTDAAEDLTQDFLCDIVLERNLIGRADIEKGSFRTFLLHTLKQYLIDKNRRNKAQKRIPDIKLVSLETVDSSTLSRSLAQTTAEDAYHFAWIKTLLEEVASSVKVACYRQGMKIHWDLFWEHILQPIFSGSPASLPHLCEKHGIENTKKVSNMIVTVKRRFRHMLMQHVQNTVASDEEASEELDYFTHFLQKNKLCRQNNARPYT
ncbi:MAG: hypothetical protein K9N55_20510 [Phycisphaerae bacterium]|nr:hypothetical protein [Phycisphaerae bacterium]